MDELAIISEQCKESNSNTFLLLICAHIIRARMFNG